MAHLELSLPAAGQVTPLEPGRCYVLRLPAHATHAQAAQVSADLRAALERLPPEQRPVVWLAQGGLDALDVTAARAEPAERQSEQPRSVTDQEDAMDRDNPLLHTPGRHAVRRKRILISCDLLQQLVTQDSDSADFPWGARCTQGLPRDAHLVHSGVEWQGSSPLLAMVFEHPSWPQVREGEEIPVLVPVFQQYPRATPQAPELAPQSASPERDADRN